MQESHEMTRVSALAPGSTHGCTVCLENFLKCENWKIVHILHALCQVCCMQYKLIQLQQW